MKKHIVIAGSGPAGIAAAVEAAKCGARVTLCDNNPRSGGQIWRHSPAKPAPAKARRWIEKLQNDNIEIRYATQVIDRIDNKTIISSEKDGMQIIPDSQLILATGARELFLPFPGWTLPQVTGCGGIQALIKSGLDVKGKRIVVAGTGPLLLAVAASLKSAGAEILAIAEQAPFSKMLPFTMYMLRYPDKLLQGAGYRLQTISTRMSFGTWVKSAEGDDTVKKVTLTDGKREWSHNVDMLAVGYHLIPNTELARVIGCKTDKDSIQVDALQSTSIKGIYCAGEGCGIAGVDTAIAEGRIAALSACGHIDEATKLHNQYKSRNRFRQELTEVTKVRSEIHQLSEEKTTFCRCEDVTYGQVKEVSCQKAAKLYTRCGMGPCQGRICSAAGRELFGWKLNSMKGPLIPLPLEDMLTYSELKK